MRKQWMMVVVTVLVAACSAYVPPSGRGYDYDRGRAQARVDIDAGLLVYYALVDQVEHVRSGSGQPRPGCDFTLRWIDVGVDADRHQIDYVEGYNSVSVPVIENKLGEPIADALRRCAGTE